MIDGSLAEREIGDQIAFHVDLEQMPDSLAHVAVVAVDELQEPLRVRTRTSTDDTTSIIADLHHPLWMIRGELHRNGLDQLPGRLARQALDKVGDGRLSRSFGHGAALLA